MKLPCFVERYVCRVHALLPHANYPRTSLLSSRLRKAIVKPTKNAATPAGIFLREGGSHSPQFSTDRPKSILQIAERSVARSQVYDEA